MSGRRWIFAVVAALAALAFGVPAAADSTPVVWVDPSADTVDRFDLDCVVDVTGQDPRTGEFTLGPVRCVAGDAGVESLLDSGVATRSSSSIARHFDGFNGSGASLAITGTTCNGGWLNLPASWQDRVSSSYRQVSPCTIVHYSGLSLTGSTETQSFGNLGGLNNRASSIRYN